MVPSAERTAHRVGNTAWKNQRVVLITGAGRGVGKATARELARRGMKVVLCSRTASELKEAARVIRSEGGVCGWEIANLVREKEIVALCTKVLRTHGRVDAFMNNAARIYYGGLAESSCREWDALMDTNLRAPFLLIKHFAPAMARTGDGRRSLMSARRQAYRELETSLFTARRNSALSVFRNRSAGSWPRKEFA